MTVTIKKTASTGSAENFISFLNSRLEECGCSDEKARRALDTAADEILSNIIDYAYPGSDCGEIEMSCEISAGSAEVTFKDSGTPFNPLEHIPSGEISENGGYGIMLTRALMDDVSYTFSEGQNCLTIIKKWI